MCGLAGVIHTSRPRHRAELCGVARAMADAITHRGPDDAGVWGDSDTGVALSFRRLAILDLSDAGHQPMVSRNGQLVLVFNGEIYNHEALRAQLPSGVLEHQWVGHSDTETLLACFDVWGVTKTLERAVGMFAFALWDSQDRRLHLARDRFGEKPLYYGWTKDAFIFGSELNALRRHPSFTNQIDPDVLALYFQYSCVPAPYSIYKDIYKLQPGCVLSLSLTGALTPPSLPLFAPARQTGVALEQYWSLTDVALHGMATELQDERDATERLEAALAEAVRLQSVADVPLGAFLSGGVDSSVIVALMQAQSNRQVKTFTIGFAEAGFNEAPYARAIAEHLQTDHTELYLSAQQTRDVIPALPQVYAEPFADSSQIPTYLVSQIARHHVTVALSGDGGDELFGGYTRYLWAPRLWKGLRWMPQPLRRGLAGAIQRVPPETWDRVSDIAPGGPRVSRLGDKLYKMADRIRSAEGVNGVYRTLVTTWRADAAIVRGARLLPTPLDLAMSASPAAAAEHRMMLWDALTYLPDDILHKVDRAAMGVSLETRAPFLDHRVAELAWRLPLHMKIRNGQSKWVLRQVLYRHVPPALIERPKMGFGIPVGDWLRGPLRDWAEGLLDEVKLRSDGYLNPTPIRQKWDEHMSGRRNWPNELWSVLMFQAWLEHTR